MRVKTVFGAAMLACVAALCLIGAPAVNVAARAAAKPNVIRETPPAPSFTDEERVAELRARRARVAERIGKNAVLVMFSGEPRVYTNDVDYEFRQENNLYYMTNLRQQGATLVMLPGATDGPREILFMPRRNAAAETWTGHMYSPEEARAASGVEEIWEAREFEPFMRSLRGRRAYRPRKEAVLASSFSLPAVDAPPAEGARQWPPPAQQPSGLDNLFAAMNEYNATLYLVLPGGENSREYRQEQDYAAVWAKSAVGLNVRSAWPIFAEMRMRKSPYELALMQHAIDISIEGHQRAQAVASRTQWEYETEAELDYTYKRRNADNWGYPNIVGCGPSATTLHYQESSARVRPGDLLLIDAGAEYQHYTADVTRTFPVSGKFTKEQAEVYNIVLAAQEAAFRATRPGVYLSDVHNAALEVVKDGLLKLGLITDKNSDQYRVWFMHGTSHYLGMNVHDVNVRGAKLDAGMVFTVEPGIYIRPDALDFLPKTPEYERFAAAVRPAFEKYKSVGVRIEDDILVTPGGYKNMSSALARTIPDIESFMSRAQREVRVE
ncbi:MAG TPA: aminopeptidase P family protein [Pyrinomonadaceae bacterium]|nr:aminopeptidase P family protein [Pyrinomonadaceae bacterium]